MKTDTLYLEVTKEKERLKVGIHRPHDVIWRYEDIPVPMERIETRCREVMETLNRTSRRGGGGSAVYEKLKNTGRMLCDELLTESIKGVLEQTAAEYLILNTDEHLVHIPWELLCSGGDFLCQRFCMGRMVKTRQKISNTTGRKLVRPLKMWIIANPGQDLDVAAAEGLKIFQDMARFNQGETIVEPVLDSDISADDIRENLKNYDFVHFAGHADYDPLHPARNGWRLSDGNFSVQDIDRMAGGAPMPAMIFSNACESARTEEWEWKGESSEGSLGLPNAFLRSGVRHYIGTSWEIMDEPSSYFAHEFYELLRQGMTTGAAIRQTRQNLTQQFGPDICWVSYLLYGDPHFRYFRRERNPENQYKPSEIKKKKQKKIRPVAAQTVLTRGSILNYSLNTFRFKEMRNGLYIMLALLLFSGFFWFSNIYTAHRAEPVSDAVPGDERVKVRELLLSRAEKQQMRTERLFDELSEITAGLPVSENRDDEFLTLVSVFDSQSLKQGKEKIILHAVQDQILHKQTAFRLLEQESFDIILEELIRKIRLTPPEERVHPRLLTPKLMLILEVYDEGAVTLVLMRLIENKNRQILETLFEELDNSKRILAQKEILCKNLLQKLKKYETMAYP